LFIQAISINYQKILNLIDGKFFNNKGVKKITGFKINVFDKTSEFSSDDESSGPPFF